MILALTKVAGSIRHLLNQWQPRTVDIAIICVVDVIMVIISSLERTSPLVFQDKLNWYKALVPLT